jgi:hypothetical protein
MAKRPKRSGPTFIQRSRAVASEQKAIYHNVTGAGRSGVIRQFFGVSAADETTLGNSLERLIRMRVNTAQL